MFFNAVVVSTLPVVPIRATTRAMLADALVKEVFCPSAVIAEEPVYLPGLELNVAALMP
jgi:hypothetical protein